MTSQGDGDMHGGASAESLEAARAAIEQAGRHLQDGNTDGCGAELTRAVESVRRVLAVEVERSAACHSADPARLREIADICDALANRFGGQHQAVIVEQVIGALVCKGVTLGQLRRPEDAIAVYDEVVRRFGNREEPALLGPVARALVNKGVAFDQFGRPEDAVEAFDKVVRRFGEREECAVLRQVAVALFNKAVTMVSRERPADGLAVYDELIKRFEKRDEPELLAVVASALLNKGATLGHMGRQEDAIEIYDEVVRRLVNCEELALLEIAARASFNKGVALRELGRRGDEIAVYDEVVRCFGDRQEAMLQEETARALFNKGIAFRDLGRPEDEGAVYDEITRRFCCRKEVTLLAEAAGAMGNRGFTLLRLGRPEDALAAWDELIGRFGPREELVLLEEVARALTNKGASFGELGRPEDEVVICDEVIRRFGARQEPELLKHAARALFNKGLAVANLEREGDSVLALEQCISLHGRGAEARIVAEAALLRGHIRIRRGSPGTAFEEADFIETKLGSELPDAPARADYLRSRAYLAMDNRHDEAEKHAFKAFGECPEGSLELKCECAKWKALVMSSGGRHRDAAEFLLGWVDRLGQLLKEEQDYGKSRDNTGLMTALDAVDDHFDAIAHFWRAIPDEELTETERSDWRLRSLWILDLPRARNLVRAMPHALPGEREGPTSGGLPPCEGSVLERFSKALLVDKCLPRRGASLAALQGQSRDSSAGASDPLAGSQALTPENLEVIGRNAPEGTVFLLFTPVDDDLQVVPARIGGGGEVELERGFTVANRVERMKTRVWMDRHRRLADVAQMSAAVDKPIIERSLSILDDLKTAQKRMSMSDSFTAALYELRGRALFGLHKARAAENCWRRAAKLYEEDWDRHRCEELAARASKGDLETACLVRQAFDPLWSATGDLCGDLNELLNETGDLFESLRGRDVVLVTNKDVHDLPWTYMLAGAARSVTRCFSLKVLAAQYAAAEKLQPLAGKSSLCYFAAPTGHPDAGQLVQARTAWKGLVEDGPGSLYDPARSMAFGDGDPKGTRGNFDAGHNACDVLMLVAHGQLAEWREERLACGWALQDRLLRLRELERRRFDFSPMRDVVLLSCGQALSGMWAGGSYVRGMYPALCRCGATSVTHCGAPFPANMIEAVGSEYGRRLAEKLTSGEPAPRARALMETVQALRDGGTRFGRQNPFGLAWWVHDGVP